jgi:hypothetical protein
MLSVLKIWTYSWLAESDRTALGWQRGKKSTLADGQYSQKRQLAADSSLQTAIFLDLFMHILILLLRKLKCSLAFKIFRLLKGARERLAPQRGYRGRQTDLPQQCLRQNMETLV